MTPINCPGSGKPGKRIRLEGGLLWTGTCPTCRRKLGVDVATNVMLPHVA